MMCFVAGPIVWSPIIYNRAISGFNMADVTVNSLEECQTACLSTPGCRAVEYLARGTLCHLSSTSTHGAPLLPYPNMVYQHYSLVRGLVYNNMTLVLLEQYWFKCSDGQSYRSL